MVGRSEGEGTEEEEMQGEAKHATGTEEERSEPAAAEASLLSGFDQILQEYRELVSVLQSLRSRCNAEAMKREALEIGYGSLKQDNERLKKLQAETFIKFARQEHEKAIENLGQEHQMKIADFEKQISCFVLQNSANVDAINQLQQELAGYKMRVDALNIHLSGVVADTELQYKREIQELRDWIMVEEEEKNELFKKLQNAETELMITKTKQAEQQRESISIRHVETLKQRIMKLRKENETLKRQLANSDSADP
ncbi:hypothetical protein Taro_046579 [Colocasia esculenta]|uniref:Protein At-4/1 n=1 Tax=Colocasia esculenta TaxID=4460 RepID=A0A843X5R8_COLES|nr:hypothetical protein [Colocasia esculenta]